MSCFGFASWIGTASALADNPTVTRGSPCHVVRARRVETEVRNAL
jgi:hypothetical protein